MINGFGHDLQAKFVTNLRHNAETFFLHALEGIGRSARLVGASAEKLRARGLYLLGDDERLLPALNRAGAGDHGKSFAPKCSVSAGEGNNCVFLLAIAA